MLAQLEPLPTTSVLYPYPPYADLAELAQGGRQHPRLKLTHVAFKLCRIFGDHVHHAQAAIGFAIYKSRFRIATLVHPHQIPGYGL